MPTSPTPPILFDQSTLWSTLTNTTPTSYSLITLFAALTALVIMALLTPAMPPSKLRNASHPQAYILHTSVTHGRYLPIESKHAFTYPALFMLVSLRALEEHALNLGLSSKSYWAWAFGYGGPKRRLTAISPRGYLSSGKEGEKGRVIERLEEVLRRDRDWRRSRGPEDGKKEKEEQEEEERRIVVEDAWMLTMPSFVGWEGINPLTVYFVYSPPEGRGQGEEENVFTFVVLEIHNTFGESHVHVLKVGEEEDREELRGRGYDHQWTFPRQFHVSPFNDRSGYYTVGVKRPSHPPTSALCSKLPEPPKPTVRVQLYTDRAPSSSPDPSSPNPPSPDPETQNSYFPTPNADLRGELKLTAILRPTESIPFNGSVLPLFKSLMRMPFDLLLTVARIDYQAFILHYGKPRLDVYLRPEMKWTSLWRRGGNRSPVRGSTGGNSPASVSSSAAEPEDSSPITGVGGGGVKWQEEGWLERYARWKVEKFLRKRVDEVGIKVTLVPANPAMKVRRFIPEIMKTRSTTTSTSHYKEESQEEDLDGNDDVEWLWNRNGQSTTPSLPMTPSPGTPRPPLSASSSSSSLPSSSTPAFGNASWQEDAHLRIGYLSPKLFTTLLFCPSAEYALLLGCDTEGWFKVSSRHLFINVFARNEEDSYPNSPTSCRTSCLQGLRVRDIPTTPSFPKETEASTSSSNSKQLREKNYIPIPIPPTHFLDRFGTPTHSRLFSLYGFLDSLYFFDFLSYSVIQTQFGLDALEKKVFGWLKARVVQGQEPWMAWERAGRVYWGDVDEQEHGERGGGGIGSVRRPE